MLQHAKTLAKWLEWTCLALIPVVTGLLRVQPDSMESPLAREFVRVVHGLPVASILFLSVGGLLGKVSQSALERWATDHKTVRAVLNAVHTNYFAGVPENERYQHRVSLFSARRYWRDFPFLSFWSWRTTWKPALRLYCRSGTAYHGSTTTLAIDDEDENGNDGVAGRAWFANAEWTAMNLPEWPSPEPIDPSNDPVCIDYATRGFMAVQTCAKIKVKSRSVTASVVRKAGERWGVVVFDSRHPDGVTLTPEKTSVVKLTAFLLSQIV